MTDSSTATPLEQARADDRTQLLETEAKQLFASAGIDVPDGSRADSVDEAVAVAEDLGYPVAVKVSSPAIQHKSAWQGGIGVAPALEDGEDVRTAAERILQATGDRDAPSVLVEEAVPTERGVETIVGGVRDPSFGPVVLFGLGGTLAEAIEDTSHRLAPVSQAEAETMIRELDASEILDGFRDRPDVDTQAIARTITTVGKLLASTDSMQEVEINPLLATADGTVALDGLVTQQ